MVFIQTATFDGNLERWLPIEYWSYWDGPRTFKLQFQSKTFIFDSPFLELRDDYADYYIVYKGEIPVEEFRKVASMDLPLSRPIVDIMQLDALVFDETRRSYVQREPLLERWKNWEGIVKGPAQA